VLTLATCLFPFGMAEHTKFLSEKAIGAVVAVSVKLMVLAFIMSLVSPVLGQLRFSGAGGELKLNEILSMILVAGMLAFVVWRAPGFASDLLAASPTLGVAAVGQQVTSVVSTGISAASGAVTAGLWAARAAGGMGHLGSHHSRWRHQDGHPCRNFRCSRAGQDSGRYVRKCTF
jgi:type IV secretion system protein TrbL